MRALRLGAFALAGISLGGAAVPATAQTFSPAMQKTIAAAEKEQTVRLVWGAETLSGAEGVQRIVAGVNAMFGTHLQAQYAPMSSMGRVASRVATEAAANQPSFTDLYLGTAAQIAPLLSRGLFVPVQWTALLPGRITPELVEADGRVVKAATGFPGADVNTDIAPYVPTSYADFLKPEWKGKIATTPYGAALDVLTANDMWGRERTLEYVRKLIPQLGGLMGCTEEERIATGEFAALVGNCLGEFALPWKARGAPIERIIPSDGAARRYWYFAIPKNARSPHAAELVAAYMLTPAGQKLMWDLNKLDLHLFPDSQSQALVKKFEGQGFHFVDITVSWWLAHPEVEPAKKEIVKLLLAAKR
jgi:ABC-type Fe3+ transport system substrate-binding protein